MRDIYVVLSLEIDGVKRGGCYLPDERAIILTPPTIVALDITYSGIHHELAHAWLRYGGGKPLWEYWASGKVEGTFASGSGTSEECYLSAHSRTTSEEDLCDLIGALALDRAAVAEYAAVRPCLRRKLEVLDEWLTEPCYTGPSARIDQPRHQLQ